MYTWQRKTFLREKEWQKGLCGGRSSGKWIHMWLGIGISRPTSPTAARLASRYDVTKLFDGLPHILHWRPGSTVTGYARNLPFQDGGR